MRYKVSQPKQILRRLMLRGFVSFLNRFGFGHVFALFGGPVETRAFL